MFTISQEQLGDLKNRFTLLKENVRLDDKKYELSELKIRQADPEFWKDTDYAEEVSRKIKSLEKFIDSYRDLEDNIGMCDLIISEGDETLDPELTQHYESSVKSLEEFELYNMFKDDSDGLGCAIKITAGAGGTEAQDWAQMLFRMYTMYCEAHDFKVDVTDLTEGSPAGIKTVTMMIEGQNAYGLLKCEAGVHRLVRVSPYNAQGKRMTSFSSVFVTPIVDDNIEVTIDKSKLEEELFKRSKGAGGQNVNKVATACRLKYQYTDPETGEVEQIIVENHETRKQRDNRDRAMLILRSILYKKELDRREKEKAIQESAKSEIGWGAQIRSYVFDDSRVKDHRTGYQESNVQKVMDGGIDGFIKAYLLSKF